MKKSVRWIALIVLLMGVLAVPSYGWSNGGHMAVAFVAYEKLTPETRTRVDALVKLNPKYDQWVASLPANTSAATRREMLFMLAAIWADQIKGDGQHQADGPEGGNRPPDDGTAAQNIGYSDTAMHKYWHFIDEPFSPDGTSLQPPPVPNAETQIDAFRKTLASDSPDDLKSYDLVWLLHLVGDVHQPLHCASRFDQADPNGDSGGNNVHVCDTSVRAKAKTAKKSAKAKASKAKTNAKPKPSPSATPGIQAKTSSQAKAGTTSSTNCKGNLHSFWDDLFGTSLNPAPAMTRGKALPAAPADLAAILDTAVWVKDSSEDAVNKVYVNPPIDLGDGPFRINSKYRSAAQSLVRERIALAGARLANILNQELK